MLNISLFTEHFSQNLFKPSQMSELSDVPAERILRLCFSPKKNTLLLLPHLYLSVFDIKAVCTNSIYNLSPLCSKKEYRHQARYWWQIQNLRMQRKGIKMNRCALWRHQTEFESILIFVKLSSKVTTSSSLYVNKVTANI